MKTVEPEMIEIPSGHLALGMPPCPPETEFYHRWHSGKQVEVAAFKLGKTTVTNKEYRVYLQDTQSEKPSHIDVENFSQDNQPVTGISWQDATAYCQWLGHKTGKSYRLPGDAEWEYAARGGSEMTCYSWGNELSQENACYGGPDAPRPVGCYPPNGFGLYDMIGNVWEWCDDRFADVSQGLPAKNNPTNNDLAENRVLRGGSYLTTNILNLWVAYRHEDPVDLRHECLGFRLAI